MKRFFYYANIPYHIANHVIGPNHTQSHRRIAGFFVMGFGVGLAHFFQHEFNMFFGLLGDLVGYSIHATGFMPIAHDIEEIISKQQNQTNHEPCNK